MSEIGKNVEEVLLAKHRNTEVAMKLDESTLRDSEALFLAYVWFIDEDSDEFVEGAAICERLDIRHERVLNFQRSEPVFRTDHSISDEPCVRN